LSKLDYTLPDNLGLLSGKTINLAYIDGRGQNSPTVAKNQPGGASTKKQHLYAGIRDINLRDDLSLGFAYDLDMDQGAGSDNWALHSYLAYSINSEATLRFRYGYIDAPDVYYGNMDPAAGVGFQGHSYTTTLEYKIWENVLSRVEWRYDDSDGVAGVGTSNSNSFFLNLVYLF
jgi:hypothetical protein